MNAVGIEGGLQIRIASPGGSVEIRSTRPLLAARLFQGRSIRQTLTVMPMVFNICAQAQAIAAIRAIESAQGQTAAAQVEQARDALKRLETLREHLWRVLLDWPGFHAGPQETVLLARLTELIRTLGSLLDPGKRLLSCPGLDRTGPRPAEFQRQLSELQALLGRALFDREPERWLNLDAEGLYDWIQHADTPVTRLLRWVRRQGWERLGPSDLGPLDALPEAQLRSRLDAADADAFIAAPDWQGEPRETGPAARLRQHPLLLELRREHGNGLLHRLVARLIEIAATTLELASPDGAPNGEPNEVARPSSQGLCQLEAARGRLCHRVILDGERIERYRILAPTEWNFHPRGVAAQALAGIHTENAESARTQARLLIHAVDPCVGYELQLEAA